MDHRVLLSNPNRMNTTPSKPEKSTPSKPRKSSTAKPTSSSKKPVQNSRVKSQSNDSNQSQPKSSEAAATTATAMEIFGAGIVNLSSDSETENGEGEATPIMRHKNGVGNKGPRVIISPGSNAGTPAKVLGGKSGKSSSAKAGEKKRDSAGSNSSQKTAANTSNGSTKTSKSPSAGKKRKPYKRPKLIWPSLAHLEKPKSEIGISKDIGKRKLSADGKPKKTGGEPDSKKSKPNNGAGGAGKKKGLTQQDLTSFFTCFPPPATGQQPQPVSSQEKTNNQKSDTSTAKCSTPRPLTPVDMAKLTANRMTTLARQMDKSLATLNRESFAKEFKSAVKLPAECHAKIKNPFVKYLVQKEHAKNAKQEHMRTMSKEEKAKFNKEEKQKDKVPNNAVFDALYHEFNSGKCEDLLTDPKAFYLLKPVPLEEPKYAKWFGRCLAISQFLATFQYTFLIKNLTSRRKPFLCVSAQDLLYSLNKGKFGYQNCVEDRLKLIVDFLVNDGKVKPKIERKQRTLRSRKVVNYQETKSDTLDLIKLLMIDLRKLIDQNRSESREPETKPPAPVEKKKKPVAKKNSNKPKKKNDLKSLLGEKLGARRKSDSDSSSSPSELELSSDSESLPSESELSSFDEEVEQAKKEEAKEVEDEKAHLAKLEDALSELERASQFYQLSVESQLQVIEYLIERILALDSFADFLESRQKEVQETQTDVLQLETTISELKKSVDELNVLTVTEEPKLTRLQTSELQKNLRELKRKEAELKDAEAELKEKTVIAKMLKVWSTQRSIPLGTDRFYRNYWFFGPTSPNPGIFVEHKAYVPSPNVISVFGNGGGSGSPKNSPKDKDYYDAFIMKLREDLEGRLPTSANKEEWSWIGKAADLEALLECLTVKGVRESVLKQQLLGMKEIVEATFKGGEDDD